MADIDDKAMQTVRFNTVLVGPLLAATTAAGTSLFPPGRFGAGIVSLTSSILLGLVTDNESDLFLGPNRPYLERLAVGDDRDWQVDLILHFADWIDDNHRDIQWNGRLLFVTPVGLALGVVAITAAVGLSLGAG